MKKETKEKIITISFAIICILFLAPLIACGIVDSNAPQTARQVIQIGDEWVELAIDNEGNKKIVARNIDGNWIDVEEDFEGDIQETNANQDIQESIQNAQRQSLKNITGQEIGSNQQQTQQTQKSYDQYGKNDKIPMEMYQSIVQDYLNSMYNERDYVSIETAENMYKFVTDNGGMSRTDYNNLSAIRVALKYLVLYLREKYDYNYKMYADMFKEAASIMRQYKKIAVNRNYSELQNVSDRLANIFKNVK